MIARDGLAFDSTNSGRFRPTGKIPSNTCRPSLLLLVLLQVALFALSCTPPHPKCTIVCDTFLYPSMLKDGNVMFSACVGELI